MTTQRFAVLGFPVSHSLSPVMQNAGFAACGLDADYESLEVRPDELKKTFSQLQRNGFSGWNCTVPHKEQAFLLVDDTSPEARRIGCVNTVIHRNGRLEGHSTDGYGLLTALAEAFALEPEGRTILLAGCGGAGRSAAFALAARRPAELILANRTVAKAEALARELTAAGLPQPPRLTVLSLADRSGLAAALARADILIQATSQGLKPEDPPPFDLDLLPIAGPVVLDMIYRSTPLLRAAAARGCRIADGSGMLLHQGARSFTLWTGVAAPVEAMRQALLGALRQR